MARDHVLLAARELAIAAVIKFAFYCANAIALGVRAGAAQPICNPIVVAAFI